MRTPGHCEMIEGYRRTAHNAVIDWQEAIARNAVLQEALAALLKSSDALAHATPNALNGIPNALDLHRTDTIARSKARAAIAADIK